MDQPRLFSKTRAVTFDRVKAMSATNIVAAQEFDQAQANLTTAEQEKRLALARIATARANLAVTEAERSQIDVLERQIEMLEAEKSAKLAEADRKRIDIARFVITADFDGVIDSTFVDAGEYVSPGTRLFMYHDPNSVWVDANVKETHFNRVMLGAPARVTVDAYPGRAFTGKVIRLGEAATSQFALLPTPNPSGNFTKITQRLPIRIAVDQQDGLLRPGIRWKLTSMSSIDALFSYGASYRWFSTSAVMVASVAVVLSSTIVNVAIPDVMGAFGISQVQAQWLSTGFLAATTATMLLTDWVDRALGLRDGMIAALLVFMVGSILGGVAPNERILTLARVIQGAAASSFNRCRWFCCFGCFLLISAAPPWVYMESASCMAPALGPWIGGI